MLVVKSVSRVATLIKILKEISVNIGNYNECFIYIYIYMNSHAKYICNYAQIFESYLTYETVTLRI